MFFVFSLYYQKSLCVFSNDNNLENPFQQPLNMEVQCDGNIITHISFTAQQHPTFHDKNNTDHTFSNERALESNTIPGIHNELPKNNTYDPYALPTYSLTANPEIEKLKHEILLIRALVYQQNSSQPLEWYTEGKLLLAEDKQKMEKDLIQGFSLVIGLEDPDYHQLKKAFESLVRCVMAKIQNNKIDYQKFQHFFNILNTLLFSLTNSICYRAVSNPIENHILSLMLGGFENNPTSNELSNTFNLLPFFNKMNPGSPITDTSQNHANLTETIHTQLNNDQIPIKNRRRYAKNLIPSTVRSEPNNYKQENQQLLYNENKISQCEINPLYELSNQQLSLNFDEYAPLSSSQSINKENDILIDNANLLLSLSQEDTDTPFHTNISKRNENNLIDHKISSTIRNQWLLRNTSEIPIKPINETFTRSLSNGFIPSISECNTANKEHNDAFFPTYNDFALTSENFYPSDYSPENKENGTQKKEIQYRTYDLYDGPPLVIDEREVDIETQ